jgi:DNA modification methylase
MIRASENEPLLHPTQKPVELMQWILRLPWIPNGVICDPYMGSGPVGVACVNLGRSFIGVEIEPRYFDIACRRIEDATKQPRLPLPEAKRISQEVLPLAPR